ncbi:helix-turn-helix domain-containing protein [Streptomyces sp. NBC_00963]|uniref:helix-turn-helix domain-containing protein n=2 Tax=unclassified Streptomyces TaxID=2593676 RepID=UPI003869629C|nr:helix-turn-helix domain-containing protein [Streptomyces sp. NBC_00963]WSX69486.1 helix-turn-helix domain-containing protein [Streptomyces sp. NBC_00932]
MADPQFSAGMSALPEGVPRAGVLHVRHRHTDRFTVIGNHLAQHPRLSATAMGLALHILSLPDGASVTAKALTLRFPEGETTIRRALNELERAGYLERRRVPLGGGRVATRTFAYDKPGCVSEPDSHPAQDLAPSVVARAGRRLPATGSVRRPVAPVQPRPPSPSPPSPPSPSPPSLPPPPATGPAADLLARLRAADPRLLLSARDIQRLAPAVEDWFARDAAPAQVTRTLTANLPREPEPIRHPARFLEHRLATLLPPPLPAGPARHTLAPLHTCDGCERAHRTHDPAELCADCRPAARATARAAA